MPLFFHLAPLHGVTGRVFRQIYLKHFSGFSSVLAPFVFTLKHPTAGKNHFRELAGSPVSGIRVIPQLLGNDGGDFLVTAQILESMGFDEVNWNLGCPYARVANKKRGSGLLPYPDHIRQVLDCVCADIKIPVSVKLRLGRRDSREILSVIPVLNEYPLANVTIHARTGIQLYEGEVDLDGFSAAAQMCRHRVVYNGDIKDEPVFAALRKRFPDIDDWMIGRWAVSDPFLIERLTGNGNEDDKAGRLRAFHDDIYKAYCEVLSGPSHLLDKMKELWRYWALLFPVREKELREIARARTPDVYRKAADRILDS